MVQHLNKPRVVWLQSRMLFVQLIMGYPENYPCSNLDLEQLQSVITARVDNLN